MYSVCVYMYSVCVYMYSVCVYSVCVHVQCVCTCIVCVHVYVCSASETPAAQLGTRLSVSSSAQRSMYSIQCTYIASIGFNVQYSMYIYS